MIPRSNNLKCVLGHYDFVITSHHLAAGQPFELLARLNKEVSFWDANCDALGAISWPYMQPRKA
jgi:hypothetical protein